MRYRYKNIPDQIANSTMNVKGHKMEENLLISPPDFKLYKNRAIYIGAFLGGPLVAGYMAAENFKKLGQPQYVKRTWIISITTTVVVFGGLMLLPGMDRIHGAFIPVIYAATSDALVQKYQGDAIRSHVEYGGKLYSSWRAVWVGIVWLIVTLGIIYLLTLLTNTEFF